MERRLIRKNRYYGKIYVANSGGGYRPRGEWDSGAQTQISSTSGSNLIFFSYNVVNARSLLVKMIVLAKLPVVFAKNEFFEEFVQNALCPHFRKISTNYAIRLWESEKENIKILFANSPDRIVITIDLLKSRSDDSFLCIIFHNYDATYKFDRGFYFPK